MTYVASQVKVSRILFMTFFTKMNLNPASRKKLDDERKPVWKPKVPDAIQMIFNLIEELKFVTFNHFSV
jgi:hypothetical protein